MSIKLKTQDGESVTIESNPFGKGGEGAVYRITSPEKYQGNCIKIFSIAQKQGHRNDSSYKKNQSKLLDKEKKLQYLLENKPKDIDTQGGFYLLCWPLALMYSGKKFFGYMMPLAYADSISLYAIKPSNFMVHKKVPQIFKNKYDGRTLDGLVNRAKLCTNIAVALSILHKNRIVVVDLKPENIQISHDAKVSIVDIDSLQVIERNGTYHRAEVATLEYTPPEKFSKAVDMDKPIADSWDRFCCAVLFYEILLGIHPYNATFSGKYEKYNTLPEKIQRGLFPFGIKQEFLPSLPPENPHLNFYKLPPPLQHQFIRAFVDGHATPNKRPTIEEFGKALFECINFTEQASIKKPKFSSNQNDENIFQSFSSLPLNTKSNHLSQNLGLVKINNNWQKSLSQISNKVEENNQHTVNNKNSDNNIIAGLIALIALIISFFSSF